MKNCKKYTIEKMFFEKSKIRKKILLFLKYRGKF